MGKIRVKPELVPVCYSKALGEIIDKLIQSEKKQVRLTSMPLDPGVRECVITTRTKEQDWGLARWQHHALTWAPDSLPADGRAKT